MQFQQNRHSLTHKWKIVSIMGAYHAIEIDEKNRKKYRVISKTR